MGVLTPAVKEPKGKIKNNRSSDSVMEIVLYVIAVLFLIILIYPLYFIVIASFSDPSAVAGARSGCSLKGSRSTATRSCCAIVISGSATAIPSCIRSSARSLVWLLISRQPMRFHAKT